MALAPPAGLRGRFFTDLLSRSAYSEGAGPFRIVPAAVAVPADRADVALLARYASDRGVALTPRGAGSGIPGHNVGPGIVVDLTTFTRPTRVALARTANVGAGVTCAGLNAVAEHFKLRLPPDPSSAPFCTIGGMVATNAAGARTLRFGSIRRWVRGVEFVTADGEAGWLGRRHALRPHRPRAAAAPRVLVERLAVEERFAPVRERISAAQPEIAARFPATRKNSAGYALDAYLASDELVDLVIGAEGTLGIVTRVELLLDLVPDATGTLLVALADLADLGAAVELLRAHDPVAIELLDRTFLDLAGPAASPVALDRAAAVLLVDVEGASEAVVRDALAATQRALAGTALRTDTGVTGAERDRLWRIRHGASPALAGLPPERRSLQVIEDGCVPVAALGRYVAGIRAAAADAGIPVIAFGHAGDGHLHVNALVDTTARGFERRLTALLDAATRLLLELGGTPSGEHGDGRLRAGLLHRIYGPAVTALFADVKRAFDPAGIFNPGVIVSDGTPALAHLKVGPGAEPIPDRVAAGLRARERAGAWGLSPLTLGTEEQ